MTWDLAMPVTFWKLSEGKDFTFEEVIDSINEGLVYVHRWTKPKGAMHKSQAQLFVEAAIGDHFFLTRGNKFVCLLGQFTRLANFISKFGDGWMDRPFRRIRSSLLDKPYSGPKHWWTPNEDSTFVQVPEGQLKVFEEHLLWPYFALTLDDFETA